MICLFWLLGLSLIKASVARQAGGKPREEPVVRLGRCAERSLSTERKRGGQPSYPRADAGAPLVVDRCGFDYLSTACLVRGD